MMQVNVQLLHIIHLLESAYDLTTLKGLGCSRPVGPDRTCSSHAMNAWRGKATNYLGMARSRSSVSV